MQNAYSNFFVSIMYFLLLYSAETENGTNISYNLLQKITLLFL